MENEFGREMYDQFREWDVRGYISRGFLVILRGRKWSVLSWSRARHFVEGSDLILSEITWSQSSTSAKTVSFASNTRRHPFQSPFVLQGHLLLPPTSTPHHIQIYESFFLSGAHVGYLRLMSGARLSTAGEWLRVILGLFSRFSLLSIIHHSAL